MATINLNSNDTDNEQETINDALNSAKCGDVVKLAEGTYIISAQINTKSGVSLEGAGVGLTIIKARKIEDFFCTNDKEKYTKNLIACNGVNGCSISGMTINGGAASPSEQYKINNYYREAATGILIASSDNIEIHDIYCTWLIGDGIRNRGKSSNIEIYNYECNTSNHDGLEIYSNGDNWHIHNCNINLFVNAGIRIAGSPTNVRIDHCTFYSINELNSGGPGIELMGDQKNPVIEYCIFRNIDDSVKIGIQGLNTTHVKTGGAATVSNCVFWDCANGYISPAQVKMTDTDNIKDADPQNEAYWVLKGYGYKSDASSSGGIVEDNSCSKEPPSEKIEVGAV